MLYFAFNTMFSDGLENRIIEFVGVLDVILLILWFLEFIELILCIKTANATFFTTY